MNKGIEYLATPYTHDDELIRDFRAEVSDCIAAALTKKGRIIFAPISAWHHIAKKYNLPRDFEYWADLDEAFLSACSKLLVIKLDGWKESKGLKLEKAIAKKYGIPISYIDPQPYLKELGGKNYVKGNKEKKLCVSGGAN